MHNGSPLQQQRNEPKQNTRSTALQRYFSFLGALTSWRSEVRALLIPLVPQTERFAVFLFAFVDIVEGPQPSAPSGRCSEAQACREKERSKQQRGCTTISRLTERSETRGSSPPNPTHTASLVNQGLAVFCCVWKSALWTEKDESAEGSAQHQVSWTTQRLIEKTIPGTPPQHCQVDNKNASETTTISDAFVWQHTSSNLHSNCS